MEYKSIIKTNLNLMVFILEIPKIKERLCVINLDGFKSVGTHWIALYVSENNILYFDSFGVEYIPKEI